MLRGKRPRLPIKRTTSMTEITVDITNVDSASDGSDHRHHHHQTPHATVGPELPAGSSSSANHHHSNQNNFMMMMGSGNHDDQRFLTAMVSPRNINQLQRERCSSRSNSYDFLETAPFLKICGLCKRRLHPARDIYMYRGDTAFCSLECREQHMKQDEEKEKYAAASNSKKSQTVAAA